MTYFIFIFFSLYFLDNFWREIFDIEFYSDGWKVYVNLDNRCMKKISTLVKQFDKAHHECKQHMTKVLIWTCHMTLVGILNHWETFDFSIWKWNLWISSLSQNKFIARSISLYHVKQLLRLD
jgi:hypothetical protein